MSISLLDILYLFIYTNILISLFWIFVGEFHFFSAILMLENLNIIALLFSLLSDYYNYGACISFLVLIVISTIEVTISLSILTRSWSFDCFIL